MNPLIHKIDLNAQVRFMAYEQIMRSVEEPYEWHTRNDMIERVVIESCDHGFLSLGIDYRSGKQGVGYGHRSEGNIGLMIKALAELLGVKVVNDDILTALQGKPIRVIYRDAWGESVAKNTYIGHFMEDRFVYFMDLLKAGLVEGAEQ